MSESVALLSKPLYVDYDQHPCPICYEESTDMITQCNHYYHRECLDKWLENYDTCPYCKTVIAITTPSVIETNIPIPFRPIDFIIFAQIMFMIWILCKLENMNVEEYICIIFCIILVIIGYINCRI